MPLFPPSSISRRYAILGGAAFIGAGCHNGAPSIKTPNDLQGAEVKDSDANKSGVQASRWTVSAPLPQAVQEIYPCAHKGRLYLAGGLQAENGLIIGASAAHQSWAPGDAVWRAEPALPAPRHHPHMISFQGRLLALAGFESPVDKVQWHVQKTGWVMDEKGENWEALAPLPSPAAEAVMGITGDGALHLAGGRTWADEGRTGAWSDHIDTDHHFVLQDLNGSWQRAAPCPYKRNSTAGAVINGALHIVGGRQVGGGNLAYHTIYDAREDRWREAAPMPQAQGGLAAASLGGKLYAFGGEYFDNGSGVYPESWVYDAARDSWASLPDMPHPRHGLGAVALGGRIYVIGGALQASGLDTSPLVDVFTP